MSTDSERPSERAMRLARQDMIADATKGGKPAASASYKWAYVPVSDTGQMHGPIWWYRTRKEADKMAEAQGGRHAIARLWNGGRSHR